MVIPANDIAGGRSAGLCPMSCLTRRGFTALGIGGMFLTSIARTAASAGSGDEALGWILDAPSTDPSRYAGVTIANGMIGLLSSPTPFRMGPAFLAGSYAPVKASGPSELLKGFTLLDLDAVCVNEQGAQVGPVKGFTQSLDMKQGVLHTRFVLGDEVIVETSARALRHMPFCAMLEVSITARSTMKLSVASALIAGPGLSNLAHEALPGAVRVGDAWKRVPVLGASGIDLRERRVAAAQMFLFESALPADLAIDNGRLGFTAQIAAGETIRFALVSAMTSKRHFAEPLNASRNLVTFAAAQGIPDLVAGHERAWSDLWRSDIIIEGDPETQRDVRSMLYHLYSFARAGSRQSIAPMGLSSNDYNGHIFWDAELWMFPPLLVLHPELAREIVNYRFDRLEAARQNALAHGFRGAMFPWESIDSGEEDTPGTSLTGLLEHHVTADVGIAAWNYYRVTQDRRWLRETGWPLIRDTADFWVSRVTRNSSGSYDIRNVIGPDEYAEGVDNNAFTNGAARVNLQAATAAAHLIGEHPDPQWAKVAANISIPTFADGTTRDYADYDGQKVKQADATLLAYPLELIRDRRAVRRDIDYYRARTDNGGPAMGKANIALLEARLGEPDQALATLHDSYRPNAAAPFGVLAETAGGSNPYFATGAGGALQTILFGFGGLTIGDKGLSRHPISLPQGWRSLTITGMGPNGKGFGASLPR